MTTPDPAISHGLTVANLVEMTRADGDPWHFSHVQRLLKLIALIGEGMVYDETAVTIATYLHDWGAYPRYRQPGVEHAWRSRQIAETMILPRMDLPETAVATILEAVEFHDYRDFRPVTSSEALLLREKIQDRFTLPIARQIAEVRLARLAQCLAWLHEESFTSET